MKKTAFNVFSLLEPGAITAPGDPPADHPLNGTLTHPLPRSRSSSDNVVHRVECSSLLRKRES